MINEVLNLMILIFLLLQYPREYYYGVPDARYYNRYF